MARIKSRKYISKAEPEAVAALRREHNILVEEMILASDIKYANARKDIEAVRAQTRF